MNQENRENPKHPKELTAELLEPMFECRLPPMIISRLLDSAGCDCPLCNQIVGMAEIALNVSRLSEVGKAWLSAEIAAAKARVLADRAKDTFNKLATDSFTANLP